MPEARIEIEAEEGCIDAFAAYPEGRGPWPPVILLTDSRGLRPAFTLMARRLAAHGFFVLVPEIFHPAGPEAQAEAFDAWLHYLAHERLTDDARVGVLGYGVGGALAIRLAAFHAERIAAAASFYGGGLGGAAAHHLAACMSAVVHLGHAADEMARTAEGVAGLEAALRRAGVDFEAETYAGGHGFAVPDDPAHHPKSAERHWGKVLELFDRALKPAWTDAGTAGDSPRRPAVGGPPRP